MELAWAAGRPRPGGRPPGPDSPIEALPEQLLRSGPLPGPVFEGDQADIELRLTTTGSSRGPARLSGSVGGVEVSAATGVVPRAGWVERRTLGPLGRGAIVASNWVLESSDPLGFFRFRRTGANGEVGLVLPRFASLSSSPQARELEASVSAPRSGSGMELFGVREYRPGDPLRRIHWRSSARLGELVVREYEPPGVQTVGIFCDPHPPTREAADQVARLAASEAWDCIREGGGRGAVGAGPGAEPAKRVTLLWALLEWLARYPAPSDGANWTSPPALRATSPASGEGHAPPSLMQSVSLLEPMSHSSRRSRRSSSAAGASGRGWSARRSWKSKPQSNVLDWRGL